MADLKLINAEFFKPYLTILKCFRCTGIDIFDERNVFLLKFKYTPYVIFFFFIVISLSHWQYVIQKLESGTDLLDLAVDLSFSYNSIECSIIYFHLIMSKSKIKNYVMLLLNIWRNDDTLPPGEILLKRNQLKLTDLYNSIYCILLELVIHMYMALPLFMILLKKFVLQREVPYVTPLKFTLPFDYQSNIVIFVIVYLIDYSILRNMAHTINCSLFFLSVTMNHLSTLFLLLQEDFRAIIKANGEHIDVKLKDTIRKHVLLSEMLNQLGDSFGLIFIIHVFFVTVTSCFYSIAAIVKCRPEDLKNLMLSLISFLNIYYCCKEGQLVTDSALNVATAIYNGPWEDLSCKNQKIILLSILRSQRATYIRSTSFTKISLETFKTILNTTWSFISLIANVYSN